MVTSDTTPHVSTLFVWVLFSNICPHAKRLQCPTAQGRCHRSSGRSVVGTKMVRFLHRNSCPEMYSFPATTKTPRHTFKSSAFAVPVTSIIQQSPDVACPLQVCWYATPFCDLSGDDHFTFVPAVVLVYHPSLKNELSFMAVQHG